MQYIDMKASIKNRVLSGVIATVTVAASPAVAYAASTITPIDPPDNTTIESPDKKYLFVNVKTGGGSVILDENEDSEQTVRFSDDKIKVYDKDDMLISEEESDVYVYEADANDVINIKAESDVGHQIAEFTVADSLVDGLPEETGFIYPSETFSYTVFMEEDVAVSTGFEETPDTESDPDIQNDLTVNDSEDIDEGFSVGGEDVTEENHEDDLTIDGEPNTEDDLTVGTDNDVAVPDMESPEEDLSVDDDTAEETEHFLEPSAGTEFLNTSEFASSRLILNDSDRETIIDPEHLAGEYGNLYILQYDSPEQAMNAFVYYNEVADAVQPDTTMTIASDELLEAEQKSVSQNKTFSILSDVIAQNTVTESSNLIALLDTGVTGNNVVESVSMIDDKLEGNGHGAQMRDAIVSQNPDAEILSIRVADDNGVADVSAVIAGIEYAIEQNAKIINLSMCAKNDVFLAALMGEIQKAADCGIEFVSAAGNNAEDVVDYMPGSVGRAWVIGSADKNGEKKAGSNYGITVDYNVTAESTSEAAAKFTGYISVNGIENINVNDGLIYETDYVPYVGDVPDMKVYYLCYENNNEKDVIANFIASFPSEMTEDGKIRSVINPAPDYVDYNMNGITLDVDINRGAMGGLQIPITEECVYNEEEGYIDIPGKYAGQDLTVTVWQPVESAFYKSCVPDSEKPERYRNQPKTYALENFFPRWTEEELFGARGCNKDVKINGNPDEIKVGGVYKFGSKSYTHYIGYGNESWPYSVVEGASEYNPPWGSGQVVNITDCTNPMFNNIGGKGPNGKNYLFVGCTANDNNTWPGQPLITSGSIECLEKSGNKAKFYLRLYCHGPLGQVAQSLSCAFTAIIEEPTGSVEVTKFIANSSATGNGNFGDNAVDVNLNAEFGIYKDKACKNRYKFFAFNTEDMESTRTIEGLDPGTYYLREDKRSSGCSDDVTASGEREIYEFKIEAGKTTKSFKALSTGQTVSKIQNAPCYFSGKLISKEDEKNKPLKDAIFEIKYSRYPKGDPKYKIAYTWYLKSDAKGEVHFDEAHYVKTFNGKKSDPPLTLTDTSMWRLPMGSYYIKEVQAPKGYKLSKEEKYIKLATKPNENGLIPKASWKIEQPVTIVNEVDTFEESWKVAVNAKKVKKGGQPLAGAEFTVYQDAQCNDRVGTIVSESNGMTNTLVVDLDVKDYPESVTLYAKETSAPEGFVPTDEIFQVTFKKSDFDALNPDLKDNPDIEVKYETKTFGPKGGIVNEEGEVTPTPTPPVDPPGPSGAGVHVKKTSTANQEILDLDSYSLAGAEFSVTGGGFSGTLVTDENGMSNSLALPDNHKEQWVPPVYDKDGHIIVEGYYKIIPVTTTYTVRETKPPKGHKLYTGTKTFTVTMPYDKDKTIEVAFEDEPIFCNNSLDIEKLGIKGNPVEGIVFKTEFFDASGPDDSKLKKTWYLESDANGKVLLDDAHISNRKGYQSDPFFTHKGQIVIPIDGYLQLTEVSAPAEYIIDDEPFGFPTGETLQFAKRVYNDLEPCQIRIKKYDSDGATPLPGVEFELKFLEEAIKPTGNQSPNFHRLLKEGESVVYSTDDKGEVSFDNLDHGKYQITEVKTQPGHGLLKEPIIVTLPMQMTDEEATKYGNVDFSTAKEDVSYTDKWFFYSCLYEITNNAVLKMPMTGGLGIWKYGLMGIGLVVLTCTGVLVHEHVTKKRKHKKI